MVVREPVGLVMTASMTTSNNRAEEMEKESKRAHNNLY